MSTEGRSKGDSGTDTQSGNRDFTAKILNALREKLLDLTRRNKTLNFKHSDRARSHVRVIDEIPNFLFETLSFGKRMTFKSLPEPEDEPKDERTQKFQDELEAERLTDEEYRSAMDALDPDADNIEEELKIERALRDRIRKKLGLPLRPHKEMKIQDYARILNFAPSYDLPMDSGVGVEEKKHTDKYIQTLLFPDAMERKLGGIYQQAQSALQEMGVNTLYVAFGFIEWTESDASSQKMFAPLLFLPVTLERERGQHGYKFSIISTGDDPSINLSLKAKFRKEFGIELPEFSVGNNNGAAQDTPESYWHKVAETVTNKQGWRLRRFVTVGHFAFSRLVMYEDLDPSKWPSGSSPADHDVIQQLIAGSDEETATAMVADEYDVDAEEVESKVPLLITDADSSQFSSIVDVMDNKNLVIKGPPGTGKSQTITNIIGAALATGMNVLFVAEKMAALEVVFKRLSDAGLGEFCLELHSTKSSKTTVTKSLRDRDEMQRPRETGHFETRLEELRETRAQLSRYVQTLNAQFGNQGQSLQEIIWHAQAADFAAREGKVPDKVYRWIIEDAALMSMADVDGARNALAAIQDAARRASNEWKVRENHPWYGVRTAELMPYDQEELLEEFRSWGDAVAKVADVLGTAAKEIGFTQPTTLAEARSLVEGLKQTPAPRERADSEMLVRISSSSLGTVKTVQCIKDFCERVTEFRDSELELRGLLEDPRLSAQYVREIRAANRILMATMRANERNDHIATVGELIDRAAALKERAEALNRLDEEATQLLAAFGLKSTRNAKVVLRAIAAADLIMGTDREALIHRTSETADEAQLPIIRKAQRELAEISEQRDELSRHYRYSYEDDYMLLRAHSRVILETRYWGRLFGAAYRQAKRAYIALAGPAAKKPERQIMAAALEQVADHLQRAQAFLRNAAYLKAAGRYWTGLETPFGAIQGASAFAERVRSKITKMEPEVD